jgi:hypothetical protein
MGNTMHNASYLWSLGVPAQGCYVWYVTQGDIQTINVSGMEGRVPP